MFKIVPLTENEWLAAEQYVNEIERRVTLVRSVLKSRTRFKAAQFQFDAITTAAQKGFAEMTPELEETEIPLTSIK